MTAIARDFLRVLDLGQFAVSNPERFRDRLDGATDLLLAELRTYSGSWGVARKALNLFLRDSLYNVYLQKRFKLHRAERCFEVPLDGVVAKKLRTRFHRALPAWRGVKYLDPDLSSAYQDFATEWARPLDISRVHLDIYFWARRD